VSNAPHSGYQRIDAGDTALLMDTGQPPPLALSQEAHAGCLSFELSWKTHRLVVNCGLPAVNKENWRQVARATRGALHRHVQRRLVLPFSRLQPIARAAVRHAGRQRAARRARGAQRHGRGYEFDRLA